ncbi:hypothetical protein [Shewanella sp. KT0246]|uniref:hypothetical protein n=1 Tax=Shewanella sp. KT0246 TaxID=2815912 RepID=UPI001BB99B4D|nr:hypothetical protein [Shewanella sp. KT0246]GIU52300.1 hypothetical protein TUM4249_21350 [Shewanella sp. KT0246]
MQIGCCWFDGEHKELINQSNATKWQLNNNEYWVLSILAKHRGHVVPIELLSFPEGLDGYQQKLSIAEMEQVIENFQDYFGSNHRGLIELITDQGAILYNKVAVNHSSLLDTPVKVISNAHYILIILMTLIASYFVYSNLNDPDYIVPAFSERFFTQQGNLATLSIYSSGEEYQGDKLIFRANHALSELKKCPVMLWDSITATTASDNKTVSVVLIKRTLDGWKFHNIKLIRESIEQSVVNPAWLKEVNVCAD